ncbi:hypothetical protein JYU34_006558 [Plutella xylostella]|uniref:Ig-like domain-containing protein n=1 Tax=Plutella xylostella TaxID=51655 RepID=A0ABQ7QSF0_PLUXY|nr:hypothetical protein JYU34_006558 [Plutella xylostella]
MFSFLATCLMILAVYAKDEPYFLDSGQNVTVVLGRDATLVCRVQNLDSYKVAWLRVDTQTVLTIGTHVITKNPRVAVSRPEAAAWALTVRGARRADAGAYMCQVNREPMIHATHHLQVVVPPDITAGGSGGEVRAREGEGAALHCSATGVPPPSITWRREDAAAIHINGNVTVHKWSGEWLNLSSVRRESDGAYLCIATNGVPPSVSKRIILHVLCECLLKVTAHINGSPFTSTNFQPEVDTVTIPFRVDMCAVPLAHRWQTLELGLSPWPGELYLTCRMMMSQ